MDVDFIELLDYARNCVRRLTGPENWRRYSWEMELMFESFGLLKYIEGTHLEPSTGTPSGEDTLNESVGSPKAMSANRPTQEEVENIDCRLAAIIKLTVKSESISRAISSARTSHETWQMLRDRFEPKSATRVISIRRRMNSLVCKDEDSVHKYLAGMSRCRWELSRIGCDMPDNEYAMALLAGLPHSWLDEILNYQGLRSAIEAGQPIRSEDVHRVITVLVQSRKAITALMDGGRGTNKDARSGTRGKSKVTCHNCGGRGHFARECSSKA